MIEILQTVVMFAADRQAYEHTKAIVDELSEITESSYNMIKSRTPETWVNLEDVAMWKMSIATFARGFGDELDARTYFNQTRQFTQEHDLQHVLIQLDWQEFLLTHDYNLLAEILNLRQRAKITGSEYVEPHEDFLGVLAEGVLGFGNSAQVLKRADDLAFYLADFPPQKWRTSMLFGLTAARIAHHTAVIFAELLDYESTHDPSSLKQAHVEGLALGHELSNVNPAWTLVYKTTIIYQLLTGDTASLEKSIISLKKTCITSSKVWVFADVAERWLKSHPSQRSLRLVQNYAAELDHNDVWSRLLQASMIGEVKKRLEGVDVQPYQAIVLVEGPTDEVVLEKWAAKLVPDAKLLFVPTEGWTNMNYYSTAMSALRVGKPLLHLGWRHG